MSCNQATSLIGYPLDDRIKEDTAILDCIHHTLKGTILSCPYEALLAVFHPIENRYKRGHQTDEAVRSRFRSRVPAFLGFWVILGVDGVWDFARLLRR